VASSPIRGRDPFSPLAPLLAAVRRSPLPPVLFVSGDDDWIVSEAVRRLTAAFREAFVEGEVTSYDGTAGGVNEAVADAATVALFATNRLVVLDATEILRTRNLTAEELEAVLSDAAEAAPAEPGGATPPALFRAARRAAALAAAAGIEASENPEEAARRLAGRVKRSEKAADLARLLSLAAESGETSVVSAAPLAEYASRATPGDNTLVVFAVSPDAEHGAMGALRRAGIPADLAAGSERKRQERLVALGVERAIERGALVDAEVFAVLTVRGRLAARAFLLDLDRLIDGASGKRVTEEDAERLVADERKEYGSDFVEAVASRRFVEAIRILERLLSGGEFTAFRPTPGREGGSPVRKGPRGDAAFFPIFGLLTADLRRMLLIRAALADRGIEPGKGRRLDYRGFAERLVPALRSVRSGAPPFPADVHPYLLFRSFQALDGWTLGELVRALRDLSGVDRGAKSGGGSGFSLMEAWLLSRAGP
jgi:hypothetical protein